jgi:hypothetical protein
MHINIPKSETLSVSFLFFFLAVLGLELRALTWSQLHQPYYCEGFFEIGSCELFAWVGFEPQSFRVARITGLSHWCPANYLYQLPVS